MPMVRKDDRNIKNRGSAQPSKSFKRALAVIATATAFGGIWQYVDAHYFEPNTPEYRKFEAECKAEIRATLAGIEHTDSMKALAPELAGAKDSCIDLGSTYPGVGTFSDNIMPPIRWAEHTASNGDLKVESMNREEQGAFLLFEKFLDQVLEETAEEDVSTSIYD